MKRAICAVLFLCIINAAAQEAPTANSAAYESNKRYAIELYKQNKMIEAFPLFEQLSLQNPKDAVVIELMGVCLLSVATTEKDPSKAQAMRVRSRQALLKAQALGDNSPLLITLLEFIPEDGSQRPFSAKKEVDDAMNEGEAAFAAGDLKKAITAYQRALVLDPNTYYAALFIGDAYFKLKVPGSAGLWFAQAIQINPNVETAYRYWGDSLMQEGKMAEARNKFIEGYIVQPYGKSAGLALENWAKINKVNIGHPRIQSPNAVTPGKKTGDMNITLDSKSLDAKDGSSAWMMYDLMKASWQGDEFKKRFPNEKQYRHTLVEEAEGLDSVGTSVEEQQASKSIKNLDPSLATLLRLKKDGLIEAFVLLGKADNGIAQDYSAYFKDHRDKLRKYMEDYVVPALPAAETPKK